MDHDMQDYMEDVVVDGNHDMEPQHNEIDGHHNGNQVEMGDGVNVMDMNGHHHGMSSQMMSRHVMPHPVHDHQQYQDNENGHGDHDHIRAQSRHLERVNSQENQEHGEKRRRVEVDVLEMHSSGAGNDGGSDPMMLVPPSDLYASVMPAPATVGAMEGSAGPGHTRSSATVSSGQETSSGSSSAAPVASADRVICGKRIWTREDDEKLLHLVGVHGRQEDAWPIISSEMPGRTTRSCRARWFRAVLPQVDEETRRQRPKVWTAEEDRRLEEKVARLGRNWKKISDEFGNRTPDACDIRWYSTICKNKRSTGGVDAEAVGVGGGAAAGPARNLAGGRRRWTREEDALLTQLVNSYGTSENAWPLIGGALGRSCLSCRGHFYSVLSKTTPGDAMTSQEVSASQGQDQGQGHAVMHSVPRADAGEGADQGGSEHYAALAVMDGNTHGHGLLGRDQQHMQGGPVVDMVSVQQQQQHDLQLELQRQYMMGGHMVGLPGDSDADADADAGVQQQLFHHMQMHQHMHQQDHGHDHGQTGHHQEQQGHTIELQHGGGHPHMHQEHSVDMPMSLLGHAQQLRKVWSVLDEAQLKELVELSTPWAQIGSIFGCSGEVCRHHYASMCGSGAHEQRQQRESGVGPETPSSSVASGGLEMTAGGADAGAAASAGSGDHLVGSSSDGAQLGLAAHMGGQRSAKWMIKPLKRWTPQEDEELRKLVEEFGRRNWDSISAALPGRSPDACQCRWRDKLYPRILMMEKDIRNQILQDQGGGGYNIPLSAEGVAVAASHRDVAEEYVAGMEEAAAAAGSVYAHGTSSLNAEVPSVVSLYNTGYDDKAADSGDHGDHGIVGAGVNAAGETGCISDSIGDSSGGVSAAGAVTSGTRNPLTWQLRYTREEDEQLLRLIDMHGSSGQVAWDKIAQQMPGRSVPSCRMRWKHVLRHQPRPQQLAVGEISAASSSSADHSHALGASLGHQHRDHDHELQQHHHQHHNHQQLQLQNQLDVHDHHQQHHHQQHQHASVMGADADLLMVMGGAEQDRHHDGAEQMQSVETMGTPGQHGLLGQENVSI